MRVPPQKPTLLTSGRLKTSVDSRHSLRISSQAIHSANTQIGGSGVNALVGGDSEFSFNSLLSSILYHRIAFKDYSYIDPCVS